jgi:hypothetical protein
MMAGASWMILCSLTTTAAAEVLPDAIRACKNETDDARRLQCYDREVAKFPLTPEQTFGLSQSQVQAAQRRSSGSESKSSGSESKKSEPESKPKFLTAKVVALSERPHAGFIVTFDNGQVWMQYEEELTPIHAGDLVTIKPGLLGSFWLIGPSGWATKVHRIK